MWSHRKNTIGPKKRTSYKFARINIGVSVNFFFWIDEMILELSWKYELVMSRNKKQAICIHNSLLTWYWIEYVKFEFE